MKAALKFLTIGLLICLLASCGPAEKAPAQEGEVQEAAAVKTFADTLKEPQDWAAIEAAAKAEGKVVVYASTSRIENQIEIWKDVYPDIVLEGYDTGDIASKMKEEQNAGNVIGDVWFNSEGELLFGEMYPAGMILPFVPDEFKDVLPLSEAQPFAIQRYGGDVFGYNIEQYPDGCPITNIWQLVDGTWTAKFYMEDPLAEADKVNFFVTLLKHEEELAESYKANYGTEWSADPDVDDRVKSASWLWIKKMAKNPNVVLMPGGDEVMEAMASLGMTEPAGMALTSYSKIRDTIKGEIAFGACNGVAPSMGTSGVTYLAIANNAPHPNAAKLYIRFALTVEGREPWNVLGNWPGRTDIDPPEGAPTFAESGLWPEDPLLIYQTASQMRDFWTMNALGN
ncbi:MAG: extracellular solute-binding protein [Anaerolineaceae bacterium]